MMGAWRACFAAAAFAAVFGLGSLAAIAQTAEPKATDPKTAEPAKAQPAKAKAEKTAKKVKKKGADDGGDAAPAKVDPAAALASIENGIKDMQAGKLERAVDAFSGVISRGKVPANLMARALYNRGVAYRRQTKPAQAIADLQSALWLKGGLSDAERTDALENRAAAYREAGLPDQTDADGRTAPQRSRATTASLAEKPAAQPSGGGIGALFGNLFGGNQAAAKPETAAAPAPVVKTANVSAWSNATEVKSSPQAAPARISVAKVEPAAPAATQAAGGQFRIQLAMARSRADAQIAAAKAGQELGGGGAAEIDETAFGGSTYFRVRIGAFASQAEAQAQCTRLKAASMDCHVPR